MRDITSEVERVSIIATEPDTNMTAVPAAWDLDLHVTHVPPVHQEQQVLPVTPVLPVTMVMVTVPFVMTLMMSPAPPLVTPGVMSPSSSLATKNVQVDEDLLNKEFLLLGRTRARKRAYHQATTAAGPADHALYNQRPPNSPLPPINLFCVRTFGAPDVPRGYGLVVGCKLVMCDQ